MARLARYWVPGAAFVPQERGPEFLRPVDGADWSEGVGFYRGFFSTFRIAVGKVVWFHVPFQAPVELAGKPVTLNAVSLLWETLDGAVIDWMTLQHGGMERIELTPRQTAPDSAPAPYTPPPAIARWTPANARRLSEITLPKPLVLQFGVQMCIAIAAPVGEGTVRFYGAGAEFRSVRPPARSRRETDT